MTEWRWCMGDLVEVGKPENRMAWLRLNAMDGSLMLEPIRVPELPQPGGEFTFAGHLYHLADRPPEVRSEWLEVGAYRGSKQEVTVMTVASIEPVRSEPSKKKKPAAAPVEAAAPVAPATADELKYVGVRFGEMLFDTTCTICRKVPRGWVVCDGGRAYCPGCDGRFPVQSRWAKRLNETCPQPTNDQKHWGILPKAHAQNSACSCSSGDMRTWTEIERRGDHEVASVRQFIIGGEQCFCEDCLRRHPTAALRAVLDGHYGKQRALKPVPVPPPPPTAKELAERNRLRREKEAVVLAARALFPNPDGSVSESQAQRVKQFFQAAAMWEACRPAKETK